MLRDQNLVPLSHQHQHALALCVRIDRASPIPASDLKVWQEEIGQHFRNEIAVHFTAEESVVFPVGQRFRELLPLIDDLLADHTYLRESFALAEAKQMTAKDLSAFAQRLSTHIRKEERNLFERLQALLDKEELAELGQRLEDALKNTADSCVLSQQATKLKPRK